jgi:hypothetical protein
MGATMTVKTDSSGAAIVCTHVASGLYPILLAERSDPLDNVDSGWSFVCNAGLNENQDEYQVWSINNVLGKDPSLRQYLELEVGTVLVRRDGLAAWVVNSKKE